MSNRAFVLLSVFFFALSAAYLSQFFLTTAISFDLGLVPLGAEIVASGGQMYKDMQEVMFPGSFFWLALFFKIFGSSWIVCKGVAVSIFVTTAVLILIAARQLMKGWQAFVPFLMFVIIGAPLSSVNYYHWDALMWFLAYGSCFVSALNEHENTRKHFVLAFASGIFAGLSTICFQPAAASVLLSAVVGTAIRCRRTKRIKESVAAGMAVIGAWVTVISALLLYEQSAGALPYMYEGTVKFVLTHYSTVNKVPYGYSSFVPMIMERVPQPFGLLVGAPFFLIDAVPLIVFLLCLLGFRKADRAPLPLLLWTVLGFSYWAIALHRPDIRRLFWSSQPLLIVCVAWLTHLTQSSARAQLVLRGAFAVLATGLLMNAWLYCFEHDSFRAYETRRGQIVSDTILDIIPAVCSRCQNGQKIFVYPYDTGIYFLTGTRFPARFPYLQYNYHTAEQIAEVLDDLDKSKVQYVVLNKRVSAKDFASYGFPGYKTVPESDQCVEKYIAQHYRPIGDFSDYQLLKRCQQ